MAFDISTVFSSMFGKVSSKAGRHDTNTSTMWTAPWRWRDGEGLYVGHSGEAWLYRKIPINPLVWEDPQTRLAVGSPLEVILREIGALSTDPTLGVSMLSDEREVHLLSVTWEEPGEPPEGTPEALAEFQKACLNFLLPHKALVLGVKLKSGNNLLSKGAKGLVEQLKAVGEKALAEAVPDRSVWDADYQRIDRIIRRSGGQTCNRGELAQIESWFNLGRGVDALLQVAKDSIYIDDYDRVEMAVVRDFTEQVAYAPDFQWVLDAATHPDGPSVVSVRGQLQTANAARARARSGLRRRRAQMEEEMATGDIERIEDTISYQQSQQVENFIAVNQEPILTKCSIIMARRVRDSDETYIDELRNMHGIDAAPLVMRQLEALDETLPCSNKRVNPFLQDVSLSMLAYCGLQGWSNLGDGKGVFLGLNDPDLTPCYLDLLGAPKANKPPSFGVFGDPGSGKLCGLSTRIPTPTGWSTMGELKLGDLVIGSDGRPCRVMHLSDIEETPEMYDIHLSDGQVITACKDHQWVVSNRRERNSHNFPGHKASIDRYQRFQQTIQGLEELAGEFSDSDMLTAEELYGYVQHFETTWNNPRSIAAALDFVDCQPELIALPDTVQVTTPEVIKMDPVTLYPAREALAGLSQVWRDMAGVHQGVRATRQRQNADAADALLQDPSLGDEIFVNQLIRMINGAGGSIRKHGGADIRAALQRAGVSGRKGLGEVTVPRPESYTTLRAVQRWSAPQAFKALAYRVSLKYAEPPRTTSRASVMTTLEMLSSGLREDAGHAQFAIHVTDPLELPEARLAVDPYVLGAWLGDGSRGGGQFTQGATEACTDESGVTDQAYLIAELNAAGYDARPTTSSEKTVGTRRLGGDLRTVGVLHAKHIPIEYLRASKEQRLALLQGLMDTDGTIDEGSACELTLCDERLALAALELIRSLGIKVAMTSGPAAITEEDPDNPGAKRRRVTSTRYRMHFTTTLPVFRLPRKRDKLPTEVRTTQRWIYITDIVPVPTEPGRCIMVDSPDSTYLVEGMVATHNTYLCQMIATQAVLDGQQVIFINPKGHDSLSPFAELVGGAVVKMSQLESDGGYFDPFYYCEPAMAAEVATTYILGVLGNTGVQGMGFTGEQELRLAAGLKRGAAAGARCVMEALAYVDDVEVRRMVDEQVVASGTFSLGIGTVPKERYQANRGLTLIEFDRKLDFPEKGKSPMTYSRTERISLAAIRLVTRASMEILVASGGGVMIVDEAWTFLNSSEGLAALQQIGREGRSLNLLPIFATQRVADLVRDGIDMESYISRVMVMKLTDEVEATAALTLCGLEPTPARIAFLRSCQAIPATATTPLRPAMGIHRDLRDRHAAVYIGPVPDSAHEAFTTNPEERRLRDERKALSGAGIVDEAVEIDPSLGGMPTPVAAPLIDPATGAPVAPAPLGGVAPIADPSGLGGPGAAPWPDSGSVPGP